MLNTEELEQANILPPENLAAIYAEEFELCSEDDFSKYVVFERYTTIDDESNYTERLSFNTQEKTWSAALKIDADFTLQKKSFGGSDDSENYQDPLKWLRDNMPKESRPRI